MCFCACGLIFIEATVSNWTSILNSTVLNKSSLHLHSLHFRDKIVLSRIANVGLLAALVSVFYVLIVLFLVPFRWLARVLSKISSQLVIAVQYWKYHCKGHKRMHFKDSSINNALISKSKQSKAKNIDNRHKLPQ